MNLNEEDKLRAEIKRQHHVILTYLVEIQKANKGIRRLKNKVADLSEVASDYASILNHVDEFSTHRCVSLSGRGGMWKLFVCNSHGNPSIAIHGNDPLEVLAEFRRITTKEGNLIEVAEGEEVFIDLLGIEKG